MNRTILHCDLNCFYASVECLKRPELTTFPVVVCGNPNLRHGIVLAKNQIAKNCNIKTGDTISEAKKKAKNVVCIHTNYESYIYYSKKVFDIYKQYSDYVENFGIDECWIDVTGSDDKNSGTVIATEIKERIKSEIGITVSIGVSFNKIFAKLGSDLAGVNEYYFISKDNYKEKVWTLPINNLLFAGRATTRKLNNLGIKTIGDLANFDKEIIKSTLGVNGIKLYNYANGIDFSPVAHHLDHREEKSVSSGITTPMDLTNIEQVKHLLLSLSEDVGARLRYKDLKGKKIQLTIKSTDLKSYSYISPLFSPTNSTIEIYNMALEIFIKNWSLSSKVRALSVCATDLTCDSGQISLFSQDIDKKEILDKTIDLINSKTGNAVFRASKLDTDVMTEYFNYNIGLHKVAFAHNVKDIK